MGYTENFALLRFGGTAYGGVEEWSCGLKLRHLGGDAVDPMDEEIEATIDDVVGFVTTYVSSAPAQFHNALRLNWVRLNVINKDTGKYAKPNNPHIVEGLNVTPPNAIGYPQLAICVTTRGVPKRGPAAFGRWFVPCTAGAIDSTGRISAAIALTIANAAGTFLDNLSTIDSGLGPDAWAPWHFGLGGEGSVAQKTGVDSSIAEVQVGRVWDTQRRRRNTMVEEHVTATTYP